jgi:hypothetical protein
MVNKSAGDLCFGDLDSDNVYKNVSVAFSVISSLLVSIL